MSEIVWQGADQRISTAPSFPYRHQLEELQPSGRWRIVGPLYLADLDLLDMDPITKGEIEGNLAEFWTDVVICQDCGVARQYRIDKLSNRRPNWEESPAPRGWLHDGDRILCPRCKRQQW